MDGTFQVSAFVVARDKGVAGRGSVFYCFVQLADTSCYCC